jgi:hypothetical protein
MRPSAGVPINLQKELVREKKEEKRGGVEEKGEVGGREENKGGEKNLRTYFLKSPKPHQRAKTKSTASP